MCRMALVKSHQRTLISGPALGRRHTPEVPSTPPPRGPETRFPKADWGLAWYCCWKCGGLPTSTGHCGESDRNCHPWACAVGKVRVPDILGVMAPAPPLPEIKNWFSVKALAGAAPLSIAPFPTTGWYLFLLKPPLGSHPRVARLVVIA